MPSIIDSLEIAMAELTGVTLEVGEENQQNLNSPPAVCFIPRADAFSAPRTRDREHGLISVATRMVGMEARIWGAWDPDDVSPPTFKEIRATELLVDRVILALHKTYVGNLRLEPSEWMPTGVAQLGRGYVLRFAVDMPVVPTVDDADYQTTTWTDTTSLANPPAITTTVDLETDEEGVPAP